MKIYSGNKLGYDFAKIKKQAWFVLFVFMYVFLLSAAIVLRPVAVVLLLLPLVVVLFWLAPSVRSYPKKLLSMLFFTWLAMSVLWPGFLILDLPGFPAIEPSRVFLALLIIVWLFYIINSPSLKQNFLAIYAKNSKLLLLLLLLIVTRIFSIFFSDAPFLSAFYFTKDLIEVFLPVLILLSIFSCRKDIDQFINALALIGTVVVAVSLFELIMNKNVFLLYLPPSFVVSNEFIEQSLIEGIRGGELRIKGTFSHALLLAQFLVVILPVYVYMLCSAKTKIVRVFSFFLIFIVIYLLYKTGSRSSFVGLAAEIVVVSFLYLRLILVTKKASVLGWIVIVSYPIFILFSIFVMYLTMDFFIGQTASEISSTNARFIMWDKGLSLILESPIFGFGSGSAAFVLNYISNGILTIDSYYLSVLLDFGYLGLLLFSLYFILILNIGFKLIKTEPNNFGMHALIMSSVLGYLVIALILSTAHNLHLLFILSGLLLLLHTESSSRKNMVTR